MRRSSFIKLTLVPLLASARLVHADPVPNDPYADGAGAPGQTAPLSQPAAPDNDPDGGPYLSPDGSYDGPPGEAPPVELPPGETPVVVEPVPCDVDPDQPRCQEPVYIYNGGYGGYWYGGAHRGGFGGYFHGGGVHGGGVHGGGGGHGG
jgi:hypothetical protein|nr:hypothetical protein [Kofleriaceae bacterium]